MLYNVLDFGAFLNNLFAANNSVTKSDKSVSSKDNSLLGYLEKPEVLEKNNPAKDNNQFLSFLNQYLRTVCLSSMLR